MNLFAFLRRDKKSGNVARERLMAVCETKKKSGPGLISAMICTSATVRKSISIVNSQENNEEDNYSGTFIAS